MNKLNLFEYNGNWLTDAEILLCKFYERKHFERNEVEKGKLEEKKIMANNARALEKVKESSFSIKKIISPEDILNNTTKSTTINHKEKDIKTKDIYRKTSNEQSFSNTNTITIGHHQKQRKEIEDEEDSSSVSTIPLVTDPATNQTKQQQSINTSLTTKDNGKIKHPHAYPDVIPAMIENYINNDVKTQKQIIKNIIKRKAVVLREDSVIETEDVHNQQWNNMFPSEHILSEIIWNSWTSSTYQEWILHEFSFSNKGKQTIALKLSVPTDSKSWSLNICPLEDYHNNNILLHFNPRYSGKGRSLIMTDKQGTWNPSVKKEFGKSSSTDGLLANEINLMIQIIPEGFVIFANDIYNTFFPHRRDITKLHTLKLIMNAIDGNGNKQNVILHKVWWGHKELQYDSITIPSEARDIMASTILDFSKNLSILARSILVHGLPMGVFDLVECQAVEFALTQVFLEFSPEIVSVVPGYGYAFIKFMSEESVLPAIEELNDAMMGNEDQEQYVLKLSKIECL